MKKSLVIATLIFGTLMPFGKVQAQDEGPSEDCQNNYSIFYEFYRNKSYTDAFESWKYTYENCGDLTKNIYIFGPPIIKSKIKDVGSDAEKQELISLLMEMYDRRNELFPERLGFVIGLKAIDMLFYYEDKVTETYAMFEKAIELDGYDHSAAFFNNFFNAAIRMFSAKEFTLDDVFQSYNIVSEAIEYNNNILNTEIAEIQRRVDSTDVLTAADQKTLNRSEKELERYTIVDNNLEKQIAKIATCSRLESLYNDETFESHKNDTVWLRRAVKLLQKERTNDDGETESCTQMDIFVKISERLYDMDPSSPGARSMGLLSFQRNEYKRASDFFINAAEQEADPIKAGRDYNLAANALLLARNPQGAKANALKAIKLRKDYGDAYITLAKSYAMGEGMCGNNVFEKKAVYWAAIDKLQVAKSVDPTVAEKANKLISTYKAQLPNKTVSFELGWRDGQTYTIDCYINETITVKFY
ncbi:MAG: hypothetical protein JJU02_09230 [Cryomorphaceae bacterium]|nr:hypothetical protein [Cryomorphaceae bacterium]